MAELSKQALKVQNNTEFPNNNAGLITPTKLRGFNVDMIDSLVDEISYQQDSASWNQQIDSLENFTSSVAASVSTASFNSFTQSFNSFSASVTQSIVDLQNFSSSLSGGFVTEGELQAATASLINQINTKLDTSSFNQYTASVTASITNRALLSGSNNFSGSEKFALDGAKGDSFWVSGSDGAPITLSSRYSNRVASIILGAPSNNVLQITSSSDISIEFGGDEKHYGDQIELNGYTPLYRLSDKTPSTSTTYDMKVANKEWSLILASDVNTPTIISATTQSVQINSNLNVTSSLTASIQQGYVWVGNANNKTSLVSTSSFGTTINTGSFVTTSSFNSYTQSNDQKVNALIAATGSYATLTNNTFNGNQTVNGNVIVSNIISGSGAIFGQTLTIPDSAFGGYIRFNTGSSFYNVQLIPGVGDIAFSRDGGSNIKTFTLAGSNGAKTTFQNNEVEFQVSASFTQPISIQNGIKTGVDITGSLNVSQNLSASLPQGFVWVGDASNRTAIVATSSFTGGGGTTYENPTLNPYSGSLILAANTTSTSSLAGYITASNNGQVNLMFLNRNLTGGVYISGSSNIFPNPNAPAAGRLNYLGGSSNILLTSFTANNSQTFPSMTGSTATIGGVYPAMNANILMGQNGWSINTSNNPGIHNYNNNILNGSTAFNMVGNVQTAGVANSGRFDFTGNTSAGTIIINSPSRSVAEINAGATGSVRISMTNNNIAGTLTYNGPVSGSALGIHNITTNVLAGVLTLNLQSQSRAFTITQNAINGNVTYTDNTVFAPTLGSSATLGNNSINGTLTITNRASASVGMSNSSVGGAGHTINNDTDASAITTAGQRQVNVTSTTIGGQANSIYFTGSAVGAVARTVVNSIIVGAANSASVIGSSDGAILGSTAIFGHGLNVIGTGINNASVGTGGDRIGSLFVGRWNAEDGNRNKSAETVFAIGTGTSGSAGVVRKTGFLIDSGSNAFFEGNHFISGNTNITDNLIVTGSLTASLQTGYMYVGNAGGLTTAITTSSLSAGTASVARNVEIIARNGNPSTLPAGTVVHITSAVGDNPIFTTASYDNEALSSNTLGILKNSSPSGADVEVIVNGIVTGVNTDPTLGYAAGDIVYLSSSGQFTRIQPQAPNQIVTLGQVLRAQQNNGSIYVSINNGWELNELHNVQINNPQTGDIIQYESASYGLWKNKSLSAAGVATTGSNSFAGTQSISGSLVVTGSAVGNVVSMSVSSNTASMDLSKGNYFELTSSASPLRIELSNVQAGVTSTLIVSASVSSSIKFSSNVKQPSPGAYSGSAVASTDILSFVAFNGSTVNLVATKNLI